MSPDLAKVMGQLTLELRRPIGVLLTRRGQVQEVIVGTELTLSSATLTLFRVGSRALRGLRFIRTQLHDQPLNQEVLTDLAFLRLSLIGVRVSPQMVNWGTCTWRVCCLRTPEANCSRCGSRLPFIASGLRSTSLFRGSKRNFSRLVRSTRLHMERSQQFL